MALVGAGAMMPPPMVGAAAGMMVPGQTPGYYPHPVFPQPWGGGHPGGPPAGMPPPGACGPYYPPGCSPCAPSPGAAEYEAAAYEAACRQNAAIYAQAQKVQALASLPTKGLAANSPLVTADGITTRNVPGLGGANEVTILVTPSVPACIVDWTISNVSTNFFEIRRLDCAMTKYIGSDGPMPADSFDSRGTHPVMDWPTVYPGTQIELVVANVTADPHEFRSTFHFIRGADPGSCLR
jgi:hypothetical protein